MKLGLSASDINKDEEVIKEERTGEFKGVQTRSMANKDK